MRRRSDSEVFTVDVLHRQEVAAVGLRDVEDPADIGMRDLERHPDFGQEPLKPFGVALDVAREEFERDSLTELEIIGAIDLAHAAAAEQAHHAVPAGENGAREEPAAVARGAVSPRSRRPRRRHRTGSGLDRRLVDGRHVERRAAMAAETLTIGLGFVAGRACLHGRSISAPRLSGLPDAAAIAADVQTRPAAR